MSDKPIGNLLTEAQVRDLLLQQIGDDPISQWARQHDGLSNGYVQDFLKQRSPPGRKILKAMGLRRVTVYARERDPIVIADD